GAEAPALRLEPAPTIPGADITRSVSALAHAGHGGALRRSAVLRIRSNVPPHARQAYSYRGIDTSSDDRPGPIRSLVPRSADSQYTPPPTLRVLSFRPRTAISHDERLDRIAGPPTPARGRATGQVTSFLAGT